jgi:hypothetical protein
MLAEAVLVFVVAVLLGLLLALTHLRGMGLLPQAFLMLGVGFGGSTLYLRHVQRLVAAARVEETDLAKRLALLRSRGGVSILWPIIGLVVRGVLRLLVR